MNPEDTNLLDVKVFTGDRCELDVDECADSSTHTCHNEHERCLNVEASRANPKGFACECEAGYRYSDDGSECVNINECAEGMRSGWGNVSSTQRNDFGNNCHFIPNFSSFTTATGTTFIATTQKEVLNSDAKSVLIYKTSTENQFAKISTNAPSI